ncbi:MAG: SDR family NAD(P)-dependent oxidoreductase, partial [Candidatus Lokiarchaeota archaeon]|nr:SDR family NAD(P)-dependent oxidoreductase [Candidatus Lokiarchaeota archaeon]MBD3200914.1 SDR family NAD(P)-dependent oxidoreductase [Candidatus Lokiarchaeota archaeon]
MTKKKLIKKQPFEGKNAIVCGASEGIGLATAKEIVKLGGSVCIIARREEKLKEAVINLESFKQKESQYIEYIACDATDMD